MLLGCDRPPENRIWSENANTYSRMLALGPNVDVNFLLEIAAYGFFNSSYIFLVSLVFSQLGSPNLAPLQDGLTNVSILSLVDSTPQYSL
jgi:hypothetical protein